MKIRWSNDLLVLDASAAAIPQIEQVKGHLAAWVLIRWVRPGHGQPFVYVLSRLEFFRRLEQSDGPSRLNARATLEEVLALKDLTPSMLVDAGTRPSEIRRLDTLAIDATNILSGWRYADLSDRPAEGAAVGGVDVGTRYAASEFWLYNRRGLDMLDVEEEIKLHNLWEPLEEESCSAPSKDTPTVDTDDEGTQPQRHPSIEPDGALRSGHPITLIVDLLRTQSVTTIGAVGGFDLPTDWSSFDITVILLSPDIDFDGSGRAVITVRRNEPSAAARMRGRVNAGLAPGHAVQVLASFHHGTRMCGSAMRVLAVDGDTAAAVQAVSPVTATGTVVVDLRATPPDLTVQIKMVDGDPPGRLFWLMESIPFDARPAKMDGVIDLGQKPQVEASALFTRFAKLVRGQHQRAIEGFGEVLWRKSPSEFQALYWALWDHLKRPLTIQFVTNDPHMPWELMRPVRPGERHTPLALQHAVARWLLDYKGEMGKNRLPGGDLITVAPHYTAGLELPLAEAAAQALVERLGAQPVQGKYDALMQLLETPPTESVSILFFTGHGAFSTDAVGASLLKLEDGAELTPMEVKRDEVILGERYGTIVFLNACEVGATGSVLGNVGGWADAFLARKFRAFIAPLWAVDEEDASQVTTELMDAIVTQRQPIGEALRDLRAKYGAVSPTFYSYLLYGDVTARFDTA